MCAFYLLFLFCLCFKAWPRNSMVVAWFLQGFGHEHLSTPSENPKLNALKYRCVPAPMGNALACLRGQKSNPAPAVLGPVFAPFETGAKETGPAKGKGLTSEAKPFHLASWRKGYTIRRRGFPLVFSRGWLMAGLGGRAGGGERVVCFIPPLSP